MDIDPGATLPCTPLHQTAASGACPAPCPLSSSVCPCPPAPALLPSCPCPCPPAPPTSTRRKSLLPELCQTLSDFLEPSGRTALQKEEGNKLRTQRHMVRAQRSLGGAESKDGQRRQDVGREEATPRGLGNDSRVPPSAGEGPSKATAQPTIHSSAEREGQRTSAANWRAHSDQSDKDRQGSRVGNLGATNESRLPPPPLFPPPPL